MQQKKQKDKPENILSSLAAKMYRKAKDVEGIPKIRFMAKGDAYIHASKILMDYKKPASTPPKTNYERIKAMSLTQMADFLSGVIFEPVIEDLAGYEFCTKHCPLRFNPDSCDCNVAVKDIIIFWLNEEWKNE